MRSLVLIVALGLLCVSCGEEPAPAVGPVEVCELPTAVDYDLSVDLAEDLPEDLPEDLAFDMSIDGEWDLDIGVVEQCPVIARASGYVLGRGTPRPATMIRAIPLNTIKLSALESEVVGGRVEQVEWNLITRPNGSTARLVPNNRVMEPSLFLDISGRYELELRVWDSAGRESCEPARVVVEAGCACGVHVQVLWEGLEGSPDAAIEVRYADPVATRWDEERVLSGPERIPDWGEQGLAVDDPSMDSDGSEGQLININHDPVNAAGAYRLGVWHKADSEAGSTLVRARIYADGTLRREVRRELGRGEFWEVGELLWPELAVTELDRVSAGPPGLIAR